MMFKKIAFAATLGCLYGAIVGYILPMPYSLVALAVGSVALGWFSNDVYGYVFGGE